MEVLPLTPLFEAHPQAKGTKLQDKEETLCHKITSIIKAAISFLVSRITCGKIKLFEAISRPEDEEKKIKKHPLTGGKLTIEKSLERAIKEAKIDQEEFALQLQGIAIITEILQGMYSEGDFISVQGSEELGKESCFTLTLPPPLAIDLRVVVKLLNELSNCFQILCNLEKEVFQVTESKIKDNSVALRVLKSKIKRAPFAFTLSEKSVKMLEHLSAPWNTRVITAFSSLSYMASKSHVIALDMITHILTELEDDLQVELKANQTDQGVHFLELVAEGPHVNHQKIEFAKKLFETTWHLLTSYINVNQGQTNPFFSYQNGRLILDRNPHIQKIEKTRQEILNA